MQETHHHQMPVPSTSHVKEVVEQIPAPTNGTIIGGQSHAPVRSAASIMVASFKPAGITYLWMAALPVQSTSGLTKSDPFNMDKE